MLNAFASGGSSSKVIPNVQCIWSCSEFCFRAARWNLALLIQNHLYEVVISFPLEYWYKDSCFIKSSRWDYTRRNSRHDMVLLYKDWGVWPSVVFDADNGGIALVCCHRQDHGSTKRLHTYIPRKPPHNLSAEKYDQLRHYMVQPRNRISNSSWQIQHCSSDGLIVCQL